MTSLVDPKFAPLATVDPDAAARVLERLSAAALPHRVRDHEPARHARHLAAIWRVPLHEAGRATLFYADGQAVLCLVPADRKISAPRLRQLLGVEDLRVLRADRGVGRLGWWRLPGAPGVLPAVPGTFGAAGLVDDLIFECERVVVALTPERSLALAPAAYLATVEGRRASFAGTTRLPAAL